MTSKQKHADTTKATSMKDAANERLAHRIAGGILQMQTWVARRLNRFRYLTISLILFCVTSAGLSLYFFIDALKAPPATKLSIDRMHLPVQGETPSEELFNENIPEEVYLSIQEYKRYMDSCGETIAPGLADSIRMLENLYIEQQRKN